MLGRVSGRRGLQSLSSALFPGCQAQNPGREAEPPETPGRVSRWAGLRAPGPRSHTRSPRGLARPLSGRDLPRTGLPLLLGAFRPAGPSSNSSRRQVGRVRLRVPAVSRRRLLLRGFGSLRCDQQRRPGRSSREEAGEARPTTAQGKGRGRSASSLCFFEARPARAGVFMEAGRRATRKRKLRNVLVGRAIGGSSRLAEEPLGGAGLRVKPEQKNDDVPEAPRFCGRAHGGEASGQPGRDR